MTQLRKLMLEEIQRRNFTESTRRAYLRIIEDFARHFHRPPDQLGPDHIREYTAHLFRDKKLSDNSVNQTVGALRFFFVKMLKRPGGVQETPYPKKRMRLPVILSRDEVARLIESAPSLFYRTILMTLYATGVRRTELAHLKITDIDSERMVLHIHDGKGRKDRDVVLIHYEGHADLSAVRALAPGHEPRFLASPTNVRGNTEWKRFDNAVSMVPAVPKEAFLKEGATRKAALPRAFEAKYRWKRAKAKKAT